MQQVIYIYDKIYRWLKTQSPPSQIFIHFSILFTYFKTLNYHYHEKRWVLITQLCPALCDPMDWGSPGSSVHGILQARILEWVAISFSKRSSQPRDQTEISSIEGRLFTIWATREAQEKREIIKMKNTENM